jgi:hypothetical protein
MKKLFIPLLTLSLAACGGGGGGGSSFNMLDPVAIDASNAEAISALAYDSSSMVVDSRSMLDFTRSGKTETPVESSLLGLAELASSYLPNGATLTARAYSETVSCDSGSMKLTYGFDNDANIEPGEYIGIAFNNCNMLGDTFNGNLRMTIVNYVSDFNFSVTMKYDLSSVVDGLAVSTDGSMQVGFSDSGASTDFTVSASQLSSSIGSDSVNIADLSLSVSDSGSSTTSDITMTVSSNSIDGSVMVDTNPALVYGFADIYPYSGILTVTGANGSFVTLNADTGDINTVTITVFDGATTTSDIIPWSQLDTNY